ncbi:hypothetical protein ACKFKG_25030 [Phormidesmis sp. 146-35]
MRFVEDNWDDIRTYELEVFVSPRASSGARGENRDKLNLTVTPTAKANLSVMASQRNLSMSELIEQIARQEISLKPGAKISERVLSELVAEVEDQLADIEDDIQVLQQQRDRLRGRRDRFNRLLTEIQQQVNEQSEER